MKHIVTIFLFFIFQSALAEPEFGQYRYTQYLGLQQQLQNQRMNAMRRARVYNQSPTRNIRYPNSANPYPNIQRNYEYRHLTPRQRYSPRYYQNL